MYEINPTKYSKSQTNNTGETLCNLSASKENTNNALEILSNWRASHSYPMHIFKKRLKRVSESTDKRAISSQRLKRVPSIIKKLKRKYHGKKATMKLTQMQDIAGCRVIMPNVNLAKKLYQEYYCKGDLKHKKINEKNYIDEPKSDGYRSIHLVYKFKSDKNKDKYNNLLVEVQIRSKLEHIWATAVETAGLFTGQAIKSNEGEKEWQDFFRLVSSAFAKIEKTPIVPGTPSDTNKLKKEINEMEKKLKVIKKMENWTKSIRLFEDIKNKKNAQFFLLELDTIQEKLIVTAYSKNQEEKALNDYAKAEKNIYGKPEYDVVLVGSEIEELKKTYPNYFLDTKEFIKELTKFLES